MLSKSISTLGEAAQALMSLGNVDFGESAPTVIHGIFETSSSFRVGWHTVGGVYYLFFKFILAVGLGTGLSFYGV